MTLCSFLKCMKYPPSLDFLLMTLGPAIVALSLLDRVRLSKTNPLLIFGRVPLFYFVVHFFLIHCLAVLLAFVRYGDPGLHITTLPAMTMSGNKFPADYGFSLVGGIRCVDRRGRHHVSRVPLVCRSSSSDVATGG